MKRLLVPAVLAAIMCGCGGESNIKRGEAALAGGDYATAAKCFSAALKANPTSVPLLYNLGAARAMAGDTRGAITAFRDALRCSPGEIEVSEYLADQLVKVGTPEALAEARELLDFSIAFRSDPVEKARALNSQALVEMALHHYDLALAHLIAATMEAPDYAPARYDLAVLCSGTFNLPAAAAREFDAFIAASPENGEKLEKAKKARAALGDAIPPAYSHKTTDEASALLRSGADFYAKKDYKKAIELFRAAALKDPFSFDAYINTANAYLSLGNYHEASASFAQALSIDPSRFDAALWSVRLAYAGNNFKGAIESLTTKIIPSWPEEAECYRLASFALAQERHYVEAKAYGDLFLARCKALNLADKAAEFKLWLDQLPETRFRP